MAGETKQCPCVICGKMVTVTKFATANKVKCAEHKGASGGASSSSHTSVQSQPGETKICKCVVCGVDVQVTKFATPANVKCASCKGAPIEGRPPRRRVMDEDESDITPINIAFSASDLFNEEDMLLSPSLIANQRLRDLKCPACDQSYLKILKIQDSSLWGNIIVYQCPHCRVLVSIDEQCKHFMQPMKKHEMFDYRGEKLKEFTSGLQSTRYKNAMEYLIKLCEDNGINISGMGVFANEGRPETDSLLELRGDNDRIEIRQPENLPVQPVQEGPEDGAEIVGTGIYVDTGTGETIATASSIALPTAKSTVRSITLSGRPH